MSTHSNNDDNSTLFDHKAQSQFVYVKIPVKLHAKPDPFHQRENELSRLLQENRIGDVIGWGQSFSDADPDGAQYVRYQRIDIITTNLDQVRTTLRPVLETLLVPAGTEIHYTLAGRTLMDIYGHKQWQLEQIVE
ncbi:hypothetical protein SAMN05192560_0095 [Methylobacillus rhizosphaerae]|uniref:Uncharacterized protein n=1 Tax=Methylobacillus rhizosphaerae TaxID=551994 RepID=A0A238XRH3_9PROT|nr:hypothetical protein [Methylobacillus rhizosphaerae]SNR60934.1 hypothetical protein SAMN05192560_0095 [Methylobacillus rhizosphaerae]